MTLATYLTVAQGSGDDSSPQAGGDADANSADHTADHDVPEHALLAISALQSVSKCVRRGNALS